PPRTLRAMRKPWIAAFTLLVAGSASAGDEPAGAQPAKTYEFWTKDELERIDRGLQILNLDRKDLGFQKRPIDDPFRLQVRDKILDAPLSIGDEAEHWDRVAKTGDVAALFAAANGIQVGTTRGGNPPDLKIPGFTTGTRWQLSEVVQSIGMVAHQVEEARR